MGKIGGLLALHGIHQYLVEQHEFFRILVGAELDSLGQEILRYDLLDFIGVMFLV